MVFLLFFYFFAFGCPTPQLNINRCSGMGTAGGVSYGLSSHSGNGLYVNRFFFYLNCVNCVKYVNMSIV
jgi:hypothetical protein